MAVIIYKRLFEIRILNDYYLTAKNTSFFSSILSDNDREKIIESKLSSGNLNISKDLDISIHDQFDNILRNQRIKIAKTPLGIMAAIEVEKSELVDGTIVYKPVIPLTSDIKLIFTVKQKNDRFSNFTIGRIKPRFPSTYLFDNLNLDGTKGFPSLSLPIEPFDNQITYETGELADITGVLKEALIENNSSAASNWRIVDGNGFASERDRQLLPRKFTYNFSHISGVTSATVVLSDEDANVLKTINITSPDSFSSVFLDFEKDDSDNEIVFGNYQISVTDGASYTDSKKVYFNDVLYNSYTYAILEITPVTTDPQFLLVSPDGFLRHRIPPVGNAVQAPIFEIKLRNRITFWRFTSTEPFAGPSPDHLEPGATNNILQSIQPKGLSKVPIALDFPPDPPVLYPNPDVSPLKYETDGKIYSDVSINKLNRLIDN